MDDGLRLFDPSRRWYLPVFEEEIVRANAAEQRANRAEPGLVALGREVDALRRETSALRRVADAASRETEAIRLRAAAAERRVPELEAQLRAGR